jgi:branched-chain amino acid transport system ATP-binding protein
MFLEIEGINVRYEGKGEAVKGVSLKVEEGEIVSVIGANGAGKTTILRAISGLIHPYEGTIKFRGQLIHTLPAAQIVKLGIRHVQEGMRLFVDQSVMDNLLLGAYTRHSMRDKNSINNDILTCFERFPLLKGRNRQIAGTMSGGEQQVLAIARGLMSNPALFLLDEPSFGLAPFMITEIFNLIVGLKETGMSILLVEQMARQALCISDRTYVLETGRIVLEGPSSMVARDERVKEAYLR